MAITIDGSNNTIEGISNTIEEDDLKISNAGSNGQFLSKQSGNTGGLTWATVDTSIADDSIVEAKLDVSNAPTNGQFLQAQSGEGGGLTWAAAAGGKLLQIVSATDAHKTVNSSTAVDIYDSNVAITLASTSNKVLCLHVTAYAHQSAASAQNIESTYIMKRTTSGDTVANLNTGKLRVGSATDINSSIVLLAVDTTFSNLANNYNVTIAYGDGDEAANAYNNTIVLLEIEQ